MSSTVIQPKENRPGRQNRLTIPAESNAAFDYDVENEVLVSVENVSKKFCRKLKRSMAYGIMDLTQNLLGIKNDPSALREDEFWAVSNISFELKRGQIIGLIGPNGSGKTTLLRMLAGILPPDKGNIIIKGRVGALIALGAGFHPHMSGRENIFLNGAILGLDRSELQKKFDDIVEFAEIEDFIDAPVSSYSSGMKVRVGFAIAAQMEPDILLIDEILAVGDVGFRAKCFNAIDQITKKSAVIFVSHSMPHVSRLCSHIMVLDKGMSKFQGIDVPKGIEFFYNQFIPMGKIIGGNGKAQIDKILIESGGVCGTEKIDYLSETCVHLDLTVAASEKNPNISLFFLNQDLMQIAQCSSSADEMRIENSGTPIRLILNLGKIQLNPGMYSVGITITSENRREVLCKIQNALLLQVVGKFMGYSPFLLHGQWHIVKN